MAHNSALISPKHKSYMLEFIITAFSFVFGGDGSKGVGGALGPRNVSTLFFSMISEHSGLCYFKHCQFSFLFYK